MAIINFLSLVNEAADFFQESSRMIVTWDGRNALVKPALEHQDQVDTAILNRSITYGFLIDSVLEVLTNAYGIARDEGRTAIDEYVVRKSIAKRCPYVMWC
ncbi:MAG TPA: hypothetical protein VE377_16690 [Candidatus Dormibacteraeota bacterium]|nr:hypothetical protein [Candidatus Dormibacteraeota bacterium]